MNKPTMAKIHEACKKFREAMEDSTGTKRVFIGWCIIDGADEDNFASGITLGDGLDSNDLAECMFRLNGRAYHIVNYEDL